MENLNKTEHQKNIIETIEGATEQFDLLKKEVAKVIVGNSKIIDLSIIAILSNGHILFEGPPGVAKTTLVKKLLRPTLSVNVTIFGFLKNMRKIWFSIHLVYSDFLIFTMEMSQRQQIVSPIICH